MFRDKHPWERVEKVYAPEKDELNKNLYGREGWSWAKDEFRLIRLELFTRKRIFFNIA